MPSLNATTTAVFNSVGISAQSIYSTFTALIGTAVDFMLWMIQTAWPFLLGIAFIFLMYRLAHKFMGFGRR